jgi:hypothetical protein
VLEPANVLPPSTKRPTCCVADEIHEGLRVLLVAPFGGGTTMVIVPVATAADCSGALVGVTAGCSDALFEPTPEQAASATAVKIDGTRVRRFIFLCSFMMIAVTR